MEKTLNTQADPELLAFTGRVLDRGGALVERRQGRLMAVLPAALATALETPEEIRLGQGGGPLFYGSPLLDRLLRLATSEPPLVHGAVSVPYLKTEGFDLRLDEDMSFRKSRVRVMNRAESRLPYMVLLCRYVALSDERREGVVSASVQEESGALIRGLEEGLTRYEVEYRAGADGSPLFDTKPERAVQAALAEAGRIAREEVRGFLKSMGRHLRRDVENTKEYYDALGREMRQSIENRRLNPEARAEREAKVNNLPAELERKIEDLKEKYLVRVSVTACAGLRLLVPVVKLSLAVKHRAFERRLFATYNPLTRRLDPLTCERCFRSTRNLAPGILTPGFRLLCEDCADR